MPAGRCQAWRTAGEWSLAAVLQAAKNPFIILTFSCPKFYSRLLFISFKSFSCAHTEALWKMEALWHCSYARFGSLHNNLPVSDSLALKCQGAAKTSPGLKWPVNQTFYGKQKSSEISMTNRVAPLPHQIMYSWRKHVKQKKVTRARESVKIDYWQMEERKVRMWLGGWAWNPNLTIFGHLSYDVGYFRGAGRLGVQQGGEQGKNAHLLDLHTGLCVCRRKTEGISITWMLAFQTQKVLACDQCQFYSHVTF